jgi:transcriptional regulator with XRE-family HTH domain
MREREVRAMVRTLKRIQVERGLSTRGMAALLGLSPGYLSMIYSGQRRPGLRFVRAVMEEFDEIRQEIAEMLGEE